MDSLSAKETATVIRGLLKKRFPKTKFSVTTSRGSMCSSVNVRWTDGPTAGAVNALVGFLEAGRFDGMTDSYDYDRSKFIERDGVMVRPGCKYIFTNRAISPELANKCIAQIVAYWGGVDVVPVAVAGYSGFKFDGFDGHKAVRPDLDWSHHSWFAMIHRAAEDRTEYSRAE